MKPALTTARSARLAIARSACLAAALLAAGGTVRADGMRAAQAGAAAASNAVAPRSGCASGQQVVFACGTGAGRQVAVCASPGLSASTGTLQYRFLRRGKLELALPAQEQDLTAWRDTVKAGQVMYAGGGGAYLRFETGAHSYVVYSAVGRGWGQKDGLMVLSPGGKQSVQRCQGPVQTRLGPSLAERAGLQPDPEELELPGP